VGSVFLVGQKGHTFTGTVFFHSSIMVKLRWFVLPPNNVAVCLYSPVNDPCRVHLQQSLSTHPRLPTGFSYH